MMGRRYKRKLEIELDGKSLIDIKKRTIQIKAENNLCDVLKGKCVRRSK